MASAAVLAATRAHLAGFTAAPLYWPNEALPSAAPYVAVQFPIASARQASFGAPGDNIMREDGVIRFVIVVRPGSGTGLAGALAKELADLFLNARRDGLRCHVPTSPVFDDRADAHGRYAVAFVVPYEFDSFA